MIYLSKVFRFILAYGQKGHQIGRKVGDALEIIVFALIARNTELSKYLIVENGVEGASGARHKVEFSFYKLRDGKPTKKSIDLFGLIECKKVGAEVTTKQSFKVWQKNNTEPFYLTSGYIFGLDINTGRIEVVIKAIDNEEGQNIAIIASDIESSYTVSEGNTLLITVDVNGQLSVLGAVEDLYRSTEDIKRCMVVTIKKIENGKVARISVEDCLTGPQTPEKAKQASFVSLDVRKKVIGTFDPQSGNDTFVSCLVIGEISHWEEKSRSMIKLCNDYNLSVPDEIIIELFERFKQLFGAAFQDMMTKNYYKTNESIRTTLEEMIESHQGKILINLATGKYVQPQLVLDNDIPKLTFEVLN